MKFDKMLSLVVDEKVIVTEQFAKRGTRSRQEKYGDIVKVQVPKAEEFVTTHSQNIDEIFYDAAEGSSSYRWITGIVGDQGPISPSEFLADVSNVLRDELSSVDNVVSSRVLLDPVKGHIRNAVDDAAKKYSQVPGKNNTTSKYVTRIISNILFNTKTKKLAGYDFTYDAPFTEPVEDTPQDRSPEQSKMPNASSTTDKLKVTKSVRSLSEDEKQEISKDISGGTTDDIIRLLSSILIPGLVLTEREFVVELTNEFHDNDLTGSASALVDKLKSDEILIPSSEEDEEDEDKELDPEKDEIPELELDDDDEVISQRDVYGLTGQEGRADRFLPGDDF